MLIIGICIVAKFDIGKLPNNLANTVIISNIGLRITSTFVINGITNDSILKTKAIVKTIEKIGIKIIFAKIETIFKLLKKYANGIISAIVVAVLIAKEFERNFGNFILLKNLDIGFVNIMIPKTQPKLRINPTSKTTKGFKKNNIIPARDNELNESYSANKTDESNMTIVIITALTTDIEKPHKYA